MRLIHLTDPHLSTLESQSFRRLQGKRRSGYLSWQRNRRHVHRPEILDRLTDQVEAYEPDQVLLTGDLVHIGLESEMIEAANWLRRLGPPEKVMLVPGNHDNYAPDSLPLMYRHWADYLPPQYPADGDYTSGFPLVRKRDGVKLVGANSSCVTRIFSAAGELGHEQQNRLALALKNPPGSSELSCLLIHHPPFPGMTKARKALRDSARLLETVEQSPPALVLYGHIHVNRENVHNGIHAFCTASASSIRDASFRIIDLEQEESGWYCRVRLISLERGAPTGARFSLAAESSWRTSAAGTDTPLEGPERNSA